MNYLYLLIGLVILYVVYEKFKPDTGVSNATFYEEKTTTPLNIGFVTPAHRLLNIFNNNLGNKDTIYTHLKKTDKKKLK